MPRHSLLWLHPPDPGGIRQCCKSPARVQLLRPASADGCQQARAEAELCVEPAPSLQTAQQQLVVMETSHISVGPGAQPPAPTLSRSAEQHQGQACHRDVTPVLGTEQMTGPLGARL